MSNLVSQITKANAQELMLKLLEVCQPEVMYIEMTRQENVLIIDFYKEDCLATMAFTDYAGMITNINKGGADLNFSAIYTAYSEFMEENFENYRDGLSNN